MRHRRTQKAPARPERGDGRRGHGGPRPRTPPARPERGPAADPTVRGEPPFEGPAGVSPRAAGFTLVEAIIAVTLGTLVVAAAFSLFNAQQGAARAESLRLELQQNARYALDMLRRDLQETGEGMDPHDEFGVVGMTDGTGTVADSLYLLWIEPETPTHSAADDNAAVSGVDSVWLEITCDDPVDDVDDGDFLYLANGSARGVAVVEGSTREVTDSCGGSDPGGKEIGELRLGVEPVDGERHGWIWEDARNDGGAAFQKVRAAAYYLDDSDPDNPKLVRAVRYRPDGPDPGWDGRPLAEGVVDFQTALIFADGDTLVAADGTDPDLTNDYDDVNSVRLQLRVQARREDPELGDGGPYERSFGTTVTPRNQIYTRNLQDD